MRRKQAVLFFEKKRTKKNFDSRGAWHRPRLNGKLKFFLLLFCSQKRRLFFLPLFLAACSNSPPPRTFPPLDYSYLTPIVLKVSSLTVTNAYVPTPGQATLIAQDPAPPATVLATSLNQRLVASGTPGSGTATIEVASIDQQGSNLVGVLTVDLHLVSADGLRTADTEASVTATAPAPDPNADANQVQGALYDLTKQMMDPGSPNSISVQLQYQIMHNLPNWVATTAGPGAPLSAAPPSAIQATPLTAPPASPAPATGSTPPMGVLTLPPSMAPKAATP
jgi:hypothetical protein